MRRSRVFPASRAESELRKQKKNFKTRGRGRSVDFEHSQKVKDLQKRLAAFMDEHIYPNEARFFREAEEVGPLKVAPVIEEVKKKGRAAGLWNLFLPHSEHGAGLSNLEYAPLCEIMGRSL